MSLAQHYRRLARAAAWYGDHASARIYTRQALRYNAAPFKEDDHPRDEKGRFAHKEARAALQSWHAENVSQGYQGTRAEARQKTVDTVTQLGKASRTLGVNDAGAVREHLEQAGKGWESLRSHAHDWVSAVEGYLQEHLPDVATDDFLADNRDTIKEAFAEADKKAGEKIKAIHAAIQSKKRIKERIGDVKGQIGDLRSQQAKLRKDAAKMEADSTKQLDKADDRIEAGSDLVDEMLEWAEDQLVQGVTGYEDWVEKEPPHTWNTPSKLGDYPTTTGKDAAQYVAGSLSGLSQRLEQYLANLGPKYGPLADKILKQWDKKIGKWQDSNLDPIAGHVDAHVKLYADAQAATREALDIDGKIGELHSQAEDLGYDYNNANDDHHAAVDELVDVEEGLRNTLHETLTGMVEEVDAELVEEPEEDEPEDEDSDLYARSPLRYDADFERKHPRRKGGKFAPKGKGESKVGESAKGTPKDTPAPISSARSTVPIMEGQEKITWKTRPSMLDVAKHLEKRSGKPLRGTGQRELAILSDALASEAIYALSKDQNAVGWYNDSLQRAMSTIHELHPELAEDPEKESLYKAFLAITSNQQTVTSNLTRTEELYEQWKATGKIDTKGGFGGTALKAINNSLELLEELLDAKGLQGAREFLQSPLTAGEIKDLGYSLSGENKDALLRGSNIFGPKIGSFYGNLHGDFSTVTMDRWWMRTFNRLRGILTAPSANALKKQGGRIGSALSKVTAKDLYGFNAATLKSQAAKLEETGDPKAAPDLIQWARKSFLDMQKEGFKTRTEIRNAAKTLYNEVFGLNEYPAGGSERAWIRQVVAKTQEKLQHRGVHIENAELQALLWYYEKDLWAKAGYGTKKTEPTDYATEARKLVDSKKKKPAQYARQISQAQGVPSNLGTPDEESLNREQAEFEARRDKMPIEEQRRRLRELLKNREAEKKQ